MKQLYTLFIVSLATTGSSAQANKSVFLEIGGNGMGFSVNFDSRFSKSEKGFGYRFGAGFIPAVKSEVDILYPSTPTVFTVPAAINYLVGRAPSYLETGLGITYTYSSGNVSSSFWGYSEDVTGSAVSFVPSIGYRHARTGKAFQWRMCISPIIGPVGSSFWAGISAGYKF